MKHGFILCVILLAATLSPRTADGQSKMFVRQRGNNLYVSARMDDSNDIVYWFRRCMFNELYTFYRVGMNNNTSSGPTTTPEAEPDIVLNLASSDNIGPLAVSGHGWCGGNHKYLEHSARTAFNESYAVTIDGRLVQDDTEAWADLVRIDVENIILDPSRPYLTGDGADELRDTLCRESVTYRIYRNNVEVTVRHKFCNNMPAIIATYYGMQSMFEGETHTFTSGGAYGDWTPQAGVSSFTKGDYPYFRRFVEKNADACQSTFLLPEGLGNHIELGVNDMVFIGNSHGKSYHRLIADKLAEKGDETFWRGIYTWFSSPLADDSWILCYEGVVDGQPALFIDSKQACEKTLTLPSYLDIRHFEIIDSHGRMRISGVGCHELSISADGIAGCVLLFGDS